MAKMNGRPPLYEEYLEVPRESASVLIDSLQKSAP